MNIIEMENLGHRFEDGTWGLQNINLSIRQGSFVLIGGPNGSGKTSLLRHLNGLLLPHTGTVRIEGLVVAQHLAKVRQIVGMVFQDADSQIVGETVYDDVAFGPENLCLNRDEVDRRVREALQAVGLLEFSERRPYLLSGGEKRRLAIAGVLAMEPRIIIFDEPFSNLDYPGTRQILGQILGLNKNGHTILVAAHDLEMWVEHAERLIIMQAGRVVEDGLPADLADVFETFGIRKPFYFSMLTENPK